MSSRPSDPDSGTAAPPPSALLIVLMWAGIITSIPVLGLLVFYVRSNATNHTGFEPWLLGIIFAPTAALGLFTVRNGKSIRVGILAAAVGLGGLGYLTYLDSTNRLLHYERWIDRGMPPR